MARNFSKGTPEQFLNQVENRIVELEGVNSSIDASVDLYDEEEPVTCSKEEVSEFLEGKGYDMSRPGNQNYSSAVADYIDMYRRNGQDYSLDEWYNDTRANYPEDLEELKKENGHSGDFDMVSSSSKITASKEYDDATIDTLYEIADKYSGVSTPVTDSWEGDTQAQVEETAAALGISEDEAKQALIDVLGFDPNDFITAGCHSKSAVDIDDTSEEITASDDWDESEDWEFVRSKRVPDADGFNTDYTMYRNPSTGQYICMFGDMDLYPPSAEYADYESDSEEECREWFDYYNGFDDDEY